MSRLWRRSFVLTVCGLALLLGLVAVGWSLRGSDKLAWRGRLVHMKVVGQLPEIGWLDVLLALQPERLFLRQRKAVETAGLVVGDGPVRLLGRDLRSPCSAYWRTPAGEIWGRFRDGLLLHALADEICRRAAYERGRARVQPGDVVVDAGAHLGVFSRLALSRGAKLVVAFEPEPVNATCFEKTFAGEIAQGRVRLLRQALWSQRTTLRFRTNPRNTAAGSVSASGETEVPAITLDEALEQIRAPKVDFIKMDIEGSEREALAGAVDTLRRFGPKLAICIYHRPDDPEVLPALVLRANPDYQLIYGAAQIYAFPNSVAALSAATPARHE